MLIIKTIVHETIWGGSRLTKYSNSNCKKIGHLYSLISNGELESEILNGKYKGKFFRNFFEDNKTKFGLEKYNEFPFLLALVDASEDLSLQVHPNDEMAKKLENTNFGKNESWYFLEIPQTGKIYDGCNAQTHEELREKVKQNKYDDIINYLPVEVGAYVCVKAGTMHAMAAGSLVYEIEENCNATYRVYDFDRVDKNGNKRPLQTEKALKSINIKLKSKAEKYDEEKVERFYSTNLFKNKTEYTNNSHTLECLTILKGKSLVEGFVVQTGTTIVLEPGDFIKLNKSDFIIARPITNKIEE